MSDRLNYGHLRYFRAVAHEGNLTRAAERLHVSQSALSIQIRKLEERLGQALFERRNRQLVLTEAGRIALDHADAIFDAGEELVRALSGRAPDGGHSVRVGALSTLSRNFQMGFLEPALADPCVHVTLRSGPMDALLGALVVHELDVVLANRVPERSADAPWISHRIDQQTVSLIGPPAVTGPDRTQLLARRPLLLPSADSAVRAGFDALMDRLGLQPRILAEVDDMAMLRLLARRGTALAVVPPIVVRGELDSGELAELAQFPEITETFHAITLPRRFPNPIVRRLLDRAADG